MEEIDAAIHKAIPLLAAGQDDDDIVHSLTASGVAAPLAERVIAFVPLAFGRVLLSGLGIRFSDDYLLPKADGTMVTLPLKGQPVYTAARANALWMKTGQDFGPVAMRSSEFSAVNNALNAGSQPDGLVAGPPARTRIQATDEELATAPKPRRRWWVF